MYTADTAVERTEKGPYVNLFDDKSVSQDFPTWKDARKTIMDREMNGTQTIPKIELPQHFTDKDLIHKSTAPRNPYMAPEAPRLLEEIMMEE